MTKQIISLCAIVAMLATACDSAEQKSTASIDKQVLQDKIAGGWAGKMIGVTYGAPTEFKALAATYEDSIDWTPDQVKGALWQDDLYVQISLPYRSIVSIIDAPAR